MNFTCTDCNDTGSRDKLGTYLDCNECGTAATRRDLNDFVKSLGPTHPEDVALAIHQRALAMAPKQEAPAAANGALTLSDYDITMMACEIAFQNDVWEINDVDLIPFVRRCIAAAGPDAALVKALEEMVHWFGKYPEWIPDPGLSTNAEKMKMTQDNARAALSGAKGN